MNVNQKELKDALKKCMVSMDAERYPILASVLFEVSKDVLTIVSTNRMILTKVELDVESGKDFTFLMSKDEIELVYKCLGTNNKIIPVIMNGGDLTFRCTFNSSLTIKPMEDVENYPDWRKLWPESTIERDVFELDAKEALNQLKYEKSGYHINFRKLGIDRDCEVIKGDLEKILRTLRSGIIRVSFLKGRGSLILGNLFLMVTK